jgi:hypothetical protein
MIGLILRVGLSLLVAGVSYSLWLAAVLLVTRSGSGHASAALFVFAPVATAIGFGGGMAIGERVTKRAGGDFLGACIWALAGCAIGALTVYSFGPMLIVFGMFVLGTIAMGFREIRFLRRKTESA